MASIDDIARERQRLAERLARLDEERVTLVEELGELAAAERVLARLERTQYEPLIGSREASERAMADSAPRRQRRRRSRSDRSALAGGVPSLGDATLQAVEALGGGVSAAEVQGYLERELGMHVRANHLGMALQRHRRAGRLEQRDTRWSLPGAAGT